MKKMGYITFILVILLGGSYLFRESKVKNVFDEMYHARAQPITNLYTTTSFADLKITGVIRNSQINTKEEHISKLMQESYLETTLKENEELAIFFNKNKKVFKVIGTLNYSNDPNRSERFQIIYTYQMKSKKITQIIEVLSGEYGETDYRTSDPIKIKQFMKEHGLSEKDIEYYQEYFLYEKVLSDWFAHNPKSRFSLDDLGEVEIVETDVYEE